MTIFYRPDDGVAADVIPFYWQDEYHLFYLKDYRDEAGHGKGTPWWHLVTRDFVAFEDRGEALPRGKGGQDQWVFTGSVIEQDGVFHAFYTGHNPQMREQGKPVQGIMHAASPDLRKWKKTAKLLLTAPEGYEPHDWRDPFVFWNEEEGEYWMLVAARKATGPNRHRGCLALMGSPDLVAWEPRPPFWTPDAYITHECPDLFRIGDWWYLVYSTFSERFVTHYRMARSPRGPWLAPPNDAFDGRAYYAAKTAGTATQRYLFGWLPTRDGERDDGAWQWGGNLVVHELQQQQDGTLTVCAPDAVVAPFTRAVSPEPAPLLGTWKMVGNIFTAPASGRFSAVSIGAMPDECLIDTRISYQPGTGSFGLLLRGDGELERYYQVRLEPANARVVFDRWPRPGDQPFMIERPFFMVPGKPLRLRLLVDGTCLVVYVNDRVALSTRMYDYRDGNLGLFVCEGEATFSGVAMKTR